LPWRERSDRLSQRAAGRSENSVTMLSFPRRSRPFQSFRVSNVERLETESGEAAVRGVVDGREVEVRFVETSGEFRLVTEDGDDAVELTRSDLRDLGPALAQFQQNVPWVDSLTGHVLRAVNDAIFPTTLADFAPRSVSDLGAVVLLAGRTPREDIDVLLDAKGELSIIVTAEGRKAARRPLTSQEAWDLAVVLRARVDGQRVTSTRSLFAVIIEAARRQAHH
jgi:hypothetical protein